jgi:hypothetical protein
VKRAANQYIPMASGAKRRNIQTASEAQAISLAPRGAGNSLEVARRFGLPKSDVITTKALRRPKNRAEAA